jgi:hypothetical protein
VVALLETIRCGAQLVVCVAFQVGRQAGDSEKEIAQFAIDMGAMARGQGRIHLFQFLANLRDSTADVGP